MAGAGDFILTDPDGVVVGAGAVAAAFSEGGLAFTLADGAADFVIGDGFIIEVEAVTHKWEQLDLAASDGAELVAGILFLDTEAPDGTDKDGTAIVRDAVVGDNITYSASASAAEINRTNAALALLNIQVRESA